MAKVILHLMDSKGSVKQVDVDVESGYEGLKKGFDELLDFIESELPNHTFSHSIDRIQAKRRIDNARKCVVTRDYIVGFDIMGMSIVWNAVK